MPVSLFYLYFPEKDANALAAWIRHQCTSLSLHGRIRVASEGVNGTVGGTLSAVDTFELLLSARIGLPIDYKRSTGDANAFNKLIVRVVNELVTLGIPRTLAPLCNAAPHLSPSDFLAEARARSAGTVLLDARNAYESAIGHFRDAILPNTRAFSELPHFLRDCAALFTGKRVLLYCTGGVRCETASALLVAQGGARSVAQLHGGIHRFLERFPDGGGQFDGKNLVFDARLAIEAVGSPVVGRCVVCEGEWDCYRRETRCGRCRIRVLICSDGCGERFGGVAFNGSCDLCRGATVVKSVKRRRKRRERFAQQCVGLEAKEMRGIN